MSKMHTFCRFNGQVFIFSALLMFILTGRWQGPLRETEITAFHFLMMKNSVKVSNFNESFNENFTTS